MRWWPAYRLAARAAAPALGALLRRRARAGKEEPGRLGERWGRPGRPRPAGPLVWCHAASVGESLSLLPLVRRLLDRDPPLTVLVTTGTLTSARLMASRLDGVRAFHQFAPIDHPGAVARFLGHWRPAVGIWVESELWPTLILSARRRGVALALLNARLSARSARGWARLPGHVGDLLGAFDLVLAQDEAQMARLRGLGATGAETVGDLKSAAVGDAAPAPPAAMRQAVAGRTRWLAASTHDGEDEPVAAAHVALRASHPDLLTLLAPRHPGRGDAIAALLAARGLTVARRSLGQVPSETTDIWLIDTLGELDLFYPLVPLALIAGSLGPPGSIGGHNPIEAAAAGCAILHGIDTANCAAATARLDAAGAARLVADPADLAGAVGALLRDPALLAAMGDAARREAQAERHVLDAVLARLLPLLPFADVHHASA